MKLCFFLLVIVCIICAIINTADASNVVCYYTNWAQYRTGKARFVPKDVDPNLCTHIVFAFAAPSGIGLKAFETNDESRHGSKGMYEKIMDLRKVNPDLKVLLAIGGYNAGTTRFTAIAKSQSTRSTFAQEVVTFLRSRNFDGFDMDWEYPASRGSPPEDKQNFLLLMQELMNAFIDDAQTSGKPRLLLAGAFPAGKATIDNGYELAELARTMDFINLMTYDFHGGWDPVTGINSPLYAHTKDTGNDAFLNLDWVARYYVSKGVPKEKMTIGLATYGRSFTLNDASQSDVGARASPGTPGTYTREGGVLSYYEICDMINSGGRVVNVPSQRNKYAVKGRQWVGYDDVGTITEKACYAKQNGFGGIMFWTLDFDDFNGQSCGQGRYPLITAAINGMKNSTLTECARPTHSDINNNNPGTQSPIPEQDGTSGVTSQPNTNAPGSSTSSSCVGKQDGYYPDPDSCDHFIICERQISHSMRCQPGLKYNTPQVRCDWSSNVDCQGRDSKYMMVEGEQKSVSDFPASIFQRTNYYNRIFLSDDTALISFG